MSHSDPEKREGLEDLYHQQRLSGASLASQRHTPDNLGGASFGGIIKEERPLSLAEVVTHTQAMWKLQTDDDFNATLREDFFFEQVGICIYHQNCYNVRFQKLKLCAPKTMHFEFLKVNASKISNGFCKQCRFFYVNVL